MPPALQTKPSMPKLSEAARHFVLPKGIVSTGWPAVRNTCAQLKITFDPWQDGAGSAILGKRDDGLYAADAVVVSIPRQVGKTFLFGSLAFALCIANPGTLVLWTAHRYVTAQDTFNDLRTLSQQPSVKPHVKRAVAPGGNGVVEFTNKSRIMFGARERGFGRGLKRVAVVVFDEAQILTPLAIDDMLPAVNRHPNPLILYTGTPPRPSDPGEVFGMLRAEAISGESEDTLYIEFSADEDADLNDRDQWAKANPSFPHHTPARAMLRLKRNLSPESFRREALGIWDGMGTGVFRSGSWAKCRTEEAPPPPAALGIAADLDQVWLSLGACSEAVRDYVHHVGSVLRTQDRVEFVAHVARVQSERTIPVAIDAKGPAAFLIPDLEAAGLLLTCLSLDEFIQACTDIREAVDTRQVEHGNYDDLNAAVDAATWRKVGDRRAFGRKFGDIAALEAVALARHAALTPKPEFFASWR